MTTQRFVAAALTVCAASAASAQMPSPGERPEPFIPLVVDQDSISGFANALTHRAGLSGHLLWLDATANIDTLATGEGIERTVAKARAAHINTLVVDVKPLSGQVLYPSAIAPRLSEWKGRRYDPNFDRLGAILAAARRQGLRVCASVNTFSEGHKHFGVGPAYGRPEWQSVSYNVERTVVAPNGRTLPFPTTPGEVAPLGQLSVLMGPNLPKALFPSGGLSAVVDASGKVAALGEAPFLASGAPPPPGGKVLLGAGAARDWLLANVHVGETVRFVAKPVLLPMEKAPWEKVAVFVSPHNPAVRDYEISIVREIARNYDVDGIVFDRMRYANLSNDFSEAARTQFEKFLGRPVENWPADVYRYPDDPALGRGEGPLYKKWLAFRAATIQGFLRDAAAAIRATRPGMEVAVYVGSWYSEYYDVGVNWASDDFNDAYGWMTPDYYKTGYAGLLDWITTGCYYPIATRQEAREAGADPRATVESAAVLSNRVVNDVAFVYGGLYLENYKNKPEDFVRAVRACKAVTQGVMVFDLVHLNEYNWWDILAAALGEDTPAPQAVPGLLPAVRAVAADIKASLPSSGIAGATVPASLTP